jgi:hypothetical protein
LYSYLSQLFDDHLIKLLLHGSEMRFKGEQSRICCFIYILNLVIKDILEYLGSSIYQDVIAFLDRVIKNK